MESSAVPPCPPARAFAVASACAAAGGENGSVDVAALLGLRAHQLPVGAAKLHQVAMRAAFDDAAVVEHQDAVGIDDAGEPVRQDQRRAPGHQAVERAPG